MLSAIARLTANKLRNVPKKNNINSLSFNHFFRQQYNNFHIIKNTFTKNYIPNITSFNKICSERKEDCSGIHQLCAMINRFIYKF